MSRDQFISMFHPDEDTLHMLDCYVEILRKWQGKINLVSRETLREIWMRHIGDSYQLLSYIENKEADIRWVDLGSGAGFPGIVMAIAMKRHDSFTLTMIEANGKKVAFLRDVIRTLDLNAKVKQSRIENLSKDFCAQHVDYISARALAPLSQLYAYIQPFMGVTTKALLLKGEKWQEEIEELTGLVEFDLITSPSMTNPKGAVMAINSIRNVNKNPVSAGNQ